MINDKGILIKNIYYMLTYAFQILKEKDIVQIESERFQDIQDLFAEIIAKGMSAQLKHGLYKQYIAHDENLLKVRGKINIPATIKNQIQKRKLVHCEYDELSENNIYNQIIKTTLSILLKDNRVSKERKIKIKQILPFLGDIDCINPQFIKWNLLIYQWNNKNYEMLMNFCYFVLNGMLLTNERGEHKLIEFSDEHMHKLFERFVLEYYRKEHKELNEVAAKQIKWNLDEAANNSIISFLPVMQSDIMLRKNNRILIIDTKYYGKVWQNRMEKETLRSNNLYQIYTYVKNQDTSNSGLVSGMLLYAKTGEAIAPDGECSLGGNKIAIKTLDLNQEFSQIRQQLDNILEYYLL